MDGNELTKLDCIAICKRLENILEDDERLVEHAVTGDILNSYKMLIRKQKELAREMWMMMNKI